MRNWARDHGLLLANVTLFVVFFVGMVLTGWRVYDRQLLEDGMGPATLAMYLTSGAFAEATFENWESEFLQMASYVALTAFLFQRGSLESKDPDQPAPQDADPRETELGPDTPWPVRRGGWVLTLYENSLLILFLVLFAASFVLHALGGTRAFNEELAAQGEPTLSTWGYLTTSQFWFESMQNWQSEFLAIAVMVGASVYLRQRGSAESKPVAAPHHETGA